MVVGDVNYIPRSVRVRPFEVLIYMGHDFLCIIYVFKFCVMVIGNVNCIPRYKKFSFQFKPVIAIYLLAHLLL